MSSASLSLKRRRLPPAGCCVARGPVICSLCCRCHSRPNSGSGLVGGASRFDHDWGVQTWPTMHCDDHCAIDRGRRGRAAREGKADEEIFKNRLLRSSATFLPAGRAWSSANMVEYLPEYSLASQERSTGYGQMEVLTMARARWRD